METDLSNMLFSMTKIQYACVRLASNGVKLCVPIADYDPLEHILEGEYGTLLECELAPCVSNCCYDTWTSTYDCTTLSWSSPYATSTFDCFASVVPSTEWSVAGRTATWRGGGRPGTSQSDCELSIPTPPEPPSLYPGGCPSWLRAHARIGSNTDAVEQQFLLGVNTFVAGSARNAEWNPNQQVSTLLNGGVGNPANYISYPPTTSVQSYTLTYDPATRVMTWLLSNNTTTPSTYTVPANKLSSATKNYPLSIFLAASTARPAGSFPTCTSFTRIDSCELQVTGEPPVQIPMLEAVRPANILGINTTYNTQAKLGKGFTISGYATIGWDVIRPRGSDCQFWFAIVDPA